MYVLEETDYLEHHGVKGQKWGVRKQRKNSSPSNSVISKKQKIKSAIVKIAKNKKVQNVAKVTGAVGASAAIAAIIGSPLLGIGAAAVKSALISTGSIGFSTAMDKVKTWEQSSKTWEDVPLVKELEIVPLTTRSADGSIVR